MVHQLRSAIRPIGILSLLVMGVLGAPPVSAGNPCFHDFTMPPASVASGAEIKLLPCAFQPTVTQVAAGTEVTFYNGPQFSHLITGANQEWGSPDVELAPGKTISYTFDKTGIYPYACVLHPGMSGVIVVGDLTDTLAAGTTNQSGAGEPPTSVSTPAESTSNTLPIVGAGVGAGLVIGAAAAWFAIRRRGSQQVPIRPT